MHATWPIIAALYHLGRWEEALPVVDEHTEAFRQDPAPGCSFVRDGPIIGAAILAHRGALDRARALVAVVGPPTNLATASAWQARFATAIGDPATAVRISEDKARERRLYGQQHQVALLEALAALEDWGAVAELLPEARARADGNALLGPVADRVEGLVHAQAGRTPEAARALRRALGGFERLGEAFEAARTPSTWRRWHPPPRPGRCWRPPWRPTNGWPARPAGGPCGPGSARRPDRRGR